MRSAGHDVRVAGQPEVVDDIIRAGLTAVPVGEPTNALDRMPDAQVDVIRLGALLHDVGKIGVPDTILLKMGKLSKAEFEVVKQHTAIGARILSGGKFALLRLAEEIAFSHHERWDGDGYAGLRTTDIPLAGRIVAAADVFDALTQQRPYKPAWPVAEAIAELAEDSAVVLTTGGTGFGPRDVTPEATGDVLERLAPGIAEALRADSLTKTPHALLSRGLAGVRGRALVVNLPGSPGGCRDGFAVLRPALKHAVELLAGEPTGHKQT